jgi:hypothetical protein
MHQGDVICHVMNASLKTLMHWHWFNMAVRKNDCNTQQQTSAECVQAYGHPVYVS